MIKADELYNINYLNPLDVEIMKQVMKGRSYAQVRYLFEKHTYDEIDFIIKMLVDYGYEVDGVKLLEDTKQVGVILDIYW